ncbi:hypothetical protein Drorol1_Dr00015509 [Drosera rotundifolia]
MDGDGKSSASSSAEKATGGVSRRLNSKRKNKANRKRYHISKKEAEVERLRVLRGRYYMKNYPELGQIGMYAHIALKHFNEENVAQGGVEYELVEKQKQKMNFRLSLQSDRWMHANFKAKPKNAPDTDAVLFFGEDSSSVDHIRLVGVLERKSGVPSQAMSISRIGKTIEEHIDDLLHAIEGVSSRVTQLESKTRHLEHTMDDLKGTVEFMFAETEGTMRHLEKILGEVHVGIQFLKDKQGITEAQMLLQRLQFSKSKASKLAGL